MNRVVRFGSDIMIRRRLVLICSRIWCKYRYREKGFGSGTQVIQLTGVSVLVGLLRALMEKTVHGHPSFTGQMFYSHRSIITHRYTCINVSFLADVLHRCLSSLTMYKSKSLCRESSIHDRMGEVPERERESFRRRQKLRSSRQTGNRTQCQSANT